MTHTYQGVREGGKGYSGEQSPSNPRPTASKAHDPTPPRPLATHNPKPEIAKPIYSHPPTQRRSEATQSRFEAHPLREKQVSLTHRERKRGEREREREREREEKRKKIEE